MKKKINLVYIYLFYGSFIVIPTIHNNKYKLKTCSTKNYAGS